MEYEQGRTSRNSKKAKEASTQRRKEAYKGRIALTRLYHIAYWSGQKLLIPSSIPDHLRAYVDVSHLVEEDEDMIEFKEKATELAGMK